MKLLRIGFLLASVLYLATGCGPGTTPVAPPQMTPAQVAPASSREAWEQEWDRVRAEARKEGKVVIAGNIAATPISVVRKALDEKYGIAAEFVTGRGNEVAVKIVTEQNAGLYLVDVIISTTQIVITEFKPQGRVQRMDTALILPEVRDPKAWYKGELPWIDKEKLYHMAFFAILRSGIIVNTQMVNVKDLKSYYDLLDPKWKGKIVINDPILGGAGNGWFTALASDIGLDYFYKLLEQEPVILRDQRLMMEWVARGRYPLHLGADSQGAAEFVRLGAPIKEISLKEGAYTSQSMGAVSIAAKAPHPNAAKVAINWILSQEGGRMLSEAALSQSARVDVPTDFLGEALVRQPGVRYIDSSVEDYQYKKSEYMQIAEKIFGPYLRK